MNGRQIQPAGNRNDYAKPKLLDIKAVLGRGLVIVPTGIYFFGFLSEKRGPETWMSMQKIEAASTWCEVPHFGKTPI